MLSENMFLSPNLHQVSIVHMYSSYTVVYINYTVHTTIMELYFLSLFTDCLKNFQLHFKCMKDDAHIILHYTHTFSQLFFFFSRLLHQIIQSPKHWHNFSRLVHSVKGLAMVGPKAPTHQSLSDSPSEISRKFIDLCSAIEVKFKTPGLLIELTRYLNSRANKMLNLSITLRNAK